MISQNRYKSIRTVLWCMHVLFLSSLLFAKGVHGENNDKDSPDRLFIFKGSDANPPFEFIEDGRATGMNVELLQGVARVMGLNIRIELGPWDQVREEFQRGQIDGLTGFCQTRERKRFADFTFPSVISSYALVVRADSSDKSFTDGWNGSIIVRNGAASHDYLLNNGFKGKILEEPSPHAVLRSLAEGRGDGALLPYYQGVYLRNRMGLTSLVLAEESVFPWAYGFAVALGNEELLERLNKGLYKFVASGEYLNIWLRWFSETLPQKPAPYVGYLYTALIATVVLLLLITAWIFFLRREVNRRTKSLRESEERYRTLFANSSDALFLLRDKVLDCNQRACELFGLSREEILSMTPAQLSPHLQPDGRSSDSASRENIEAAMSGKPQLFSWVHLRADGEPITVEISLRAVPGLSEPALLASVRDLSPRIKAEQAVQRHQDLVHTITSTSPVGIVTMDAEGKIIFANARAERILRLKRSKLYERTYNDLRWHLSSASGASYKEEDLPFVRVMRTGKAVYDVLCAIEHADGGRSVLSVNGAPLFNNAGNLNGVVTTIEDITVKQEEEKEREARWVRLQRQQAAIIRIARDFAMLGDDFDGIFNLIVTTAAEVLEVSYSDVWVFDENRTHLRRIASSAERVGNGLETDLLDVGDIPDYMEALDKGRYVDVADVLHDPRVLQLQENYLSPNRVGALLDAPIRLGGMLVGVLCSEYLDGVRYWRPDELLFVAEVADQAAQVLAFQERRRAEKERQVLEIRMQQAQKFESLGMLAGGIAHDFSNLLTAILGNADLALMDIPMDNQAESALKEIKGLSNRAAELCRSMLTYAGKGRFDTQPLLLDEEIREISLIMAPSIPQNMRLNYRFDDNLPFVNADKGQIQQVILHLMMNASEAIGTTEGTITIKTYKIECDDSFFRNGYFSNIPDNGLYVALEVADTGNGMDADTLDKIFNPFFSTKFVGRGMGLPATLGIVRGHKGCIRIQSVLGQGSIFTILLPAGDKSDAAPGQGGRAAILEDNSRCVLLIDGNSLSQRIGRKMLTRLGYAVLSAANLEEAALYLCRGSHAIQCVLMDHAYDQVLDMEEINRLHNACNGIPALLITELERSEALRRYGEIGFTDFIAKPLRVSSLAAKLGAVMKS